MKEVNLEKLKEAANLLLFDMSEDEYKTLLEEFKTVILQMNLIADDKSVESYEPMTYPFPCEINFLREDIHTTPISRDDALKNAKSKVAGQIKLAKVGL